MPNRILRDWTDSEKVNTLDAHSERFFTRLIMKADDFGCFTANVMLVKSFLFPMLTDKVREADISRWMAECQKAGLILFYEVGGKPFLQIIDFGQRLRTTKSKYPLPTDGGHVSDKGPPETKRRETETNPKGKNFIDAWLSDLQNSSHLERISKQTGVSVDNLKSKIPAFSKIMDLDYPSQDRFLNHFKNWVNKGLKEGQASEGPKSTSVVFGKKHRR